MNVDPALFEQMAAMLRSIVPCVGDNDPMKAGLTELVASLPAAPDPDIAEVQTILNSLTTRGNWTPAELGLACLKRGRALAA